MSYIPPNINGQATNANSAPVTISSDQVFPAGFIRVTDEPRQVFYDAFDTSPDTTNLWNVSSDITNPAPYIANGILSLGTGTTIMALHE